MMYQRSLKGEKVNSLRDAIPALFNFNKKQLTLEDKEFGLLKMLVLILKRWKSLASWVQMVQVRVLF